MALLNTYPQPTPGFQRGSKNWISTSPNPRRHAQGHAAPRLRAERANSFSFRGSLFNWKAVDAFRGNLPLARTDWDRPNETASLSWTSTLSPRLINEATVGLLARPRLHRSLPWHRLVQRSQVRDRLSRTSSRARRSRTRSRPSPSAGFGTIDGGPYPASSAGPIWTSRTTSRTSVAATRSRPGSSWSTPARTTSTRSTCCPSRAAPTTRTAGSSSPTAGGGTGLAVANAAMGLFTNYGEIGNRSKTDWRALAIDAFVQDSWRASET